MDALINNPVNIHSEVPVLHLLIILETKEHIVTFGLAVLKLENHLLAGVPYFPDIFEEQTPPRPLLCIPQNLDLLRLEGDRKPIIVDLVVILGPDEDTRAEHIHFLANLNVRWAYFQQVVLLLQLLDAGT